MAGQAAYSSLTGNHGHQLAGLLGQLRPAQAQAILLVKVQDYSIEDASADARPVPLRRQDEHPRARAPDGIHREDT